MKHPETSTGPSQFPSVFDAVSHGRQVYGEPDLQFAPHPQLGEHQHPWHFRPALSVELNGFDLQTHVAGLKGPKVEVGGPSRRYAVLGGIALPPDVVVTNYGDPKHLDLPQVNAADLPHADQSLSALFSSALPINGRTDAGDEFNLRNAFTLEAKRCLEPGGILVGQSTGEADVRFAMEQGFTPVRILETEGSYPATGPYTQWDYVMVNTPPVPGLEYTYEAIANIPPAPAQRIGGVAVQAAIAPSTAPGGEGTASE